MVVGLLLLALSGGISTPTPGTPRPIHDPSFPIPTARPTGKIAARDQALRFASSALIVADWLTTIDGIRKGYREMNPLIGPKPSVGRVNLMIGAGLLMNTFAVPQIKNPVLRRGLWLGVLLFELDAVHSNRKAGCGFNFSF
ncbi:MAG TPA: hypothetical protein VG454_04930 [Gemmatimonadales bacterium]|nr:hypothetical protein [Gemmatimonadales bacterium]